jgi:hypothetical protein
MDFESLFWISSPEAGFGLVGVDSPDHGHRFLQCLGACPEKVYFSSSNLDLE